MEKLTTTRYVRKPFEIEAVRVTAQNIEEAAKWCGGQVQTTPKSNTRYIYVEVANALNDRQKMAYIGDWVMFAGKGYKVYNDAAFHKSFDELIPAKRVEILPGVTQLVIDLDIIQPLLVMTKGGTTYEIDLVNLFTGFEKKAA